MDFGGHLTRRRALGSAAALLLALSLGGTLLLRGGGSGTAGADAAVAGQPAIPVGSGSDGGGALPGATVAGASTGAGSIARAPSAATTTAPGLVVHVVGAVRRPGLYTLPQGARAADAVRRAGGATATADLEAIDLAAPIADGQQVAVPRRDAAGGGPAPSPSPGAGPAARTSPVHLNTATVEQLDALPGVGPSTAQKIVDYRSEHGAFTSVDELDAIPGFGQAKVERLRPLVAVP